MVKQRLKRSVGFSIFLFSFLSVKPASTEEPGDRKGCLKSYPIKEFSRSINIVTLQNESIIYVIPFDYVMNEIYI